jgi:hypothetical protein
MQRLAARAHWPVRIGLEQTPTRAVTLRYQDLPLSIALGENQHHSGYHNAHSMSVQDSLVTFFSGKLHRRSQ